MLYYNHRRGENPGGKEVRTMKMWKVQYEAIEDLKVENGEIVAKVRQFLRAEEDERECETRRFTSWAPVLKVEG